MHAVGCAGSQAALPECHKSHPCLNNWRGDLLRRFWLQHAAAQHAGVAREFTSDKLAEARVKCYALMRAVLKVARREGLQEARALEQDGMRCQVQRMWMRLRAALN